MDDLSPVPLLVSRQVTERIAGCAEVAELFFATENRRVREFYRRTGDPALCLRFGESVTGYAAGLPVRGCAGVGVLHLFLAEMALAIGSGAVDVRRAEGHLSRARRQFEACALPSVVAGGLINWHWLMSVCAKARGDLSGYAELLGQARRDPSIARLAEPVDYIPVIRQQVMLSQDHRLHLQLLAGAADYRTERPLDYFRTVKRVLEFLTNTGHVLAAGELAGEFVRAFAAVRPASTLISRISFLKNLAQLRCLHGDVPAARRLIRLATRAAEDAGLAGQRRQLGALAVAVEQSDVRGALLTFRV
ncbi:hypothetical protein [Crossiella sp. CA198]|uniref:hypothetical protein n=1 Tax=Crossiella sp. CA198 TaxID=3455607 RepID=UPI003F8D818A